MSEAATHLQPKTDLPPADTLEQDLSDVVRAYAPKRAETTSEPIVGNNQPSSMTEQTRTAFEANRETLRAQVDEARARVREAEDGLQDILNTLAMYERGLAMPAEDKGEPEKETEK